MDDSFHPYRLRSLRQNHTPRMAVNPLRIDAPLHIHCRMCDQHIQIPCRSDSTLEADGTWRLTVHLDHDALQTHLDTHVYPEDHRWPL